MVIVVATEFQMVSAAGSIMPSMRSLIVVVGRYSASGFCLAQLAQNCVATTAESNSNCRVRSFARQIGDDLPPELGTLPIHVSGRPADRVRPVIGRRKIARLYPRAHLREGQTVGRRG